MTGPALCILGASEKLIDDSLEGAGLHQSGRGGFLNVHADFTVHPKQRTWRRRVNLLIYFNPAVKKMILEKIRKNMAPHAVLFLGAAETTRALHADAEGAGALCVLHGAGRRRDLSASRQRMKPSRSAVATAERARGHGLAERLIRAVGAHIVARGDTPFLHTSADNPARALYERLGFELVDEVDLEIVQAAV